MKRLPPVIAVAATLFALPALADTCTDKIAAMFDGGPLDAYQRPAHRHEKQGVDASGALTTTFASVVQTPLRTISGVKGGQMILAIGDDTWIGPSPVGPWEPSPNNWPKDRESWHKAMQAQQARNLKDTECETGVTLNGATYDRVRYATQTDPNPDQNNAFFGSTDTAYIDPGTQQVMRLEQTGFFSSWLPEPGKDTHVTIFSYDDSVTVTAPQ